MKVESQTNDQTVHASSVTLIESRIREMNRTIDDFKISGQSLLDSSQITERRIFKNKESNNMHLIESRIKFLEE